METTKEELAEVIASEIRYMDLHDLKILYSVLVALIQKQ